MAIGDEEKEERIRWEEKQIERRVSFVWGDEIIKTTP